MQKVEVKKQYVAPKVAELGTVANVTLCLFGLGSGTTNFKHSRAL